MMEPAKLMDYLTARGITIDLKDGRIAPQGGSGIPSGIQNTLAIEEQRLVAYLAARAASEAAPPPARTTVVLDQPFPPGVPVGDAADYLISAVVTIAAYRKRRLEQYPDEFKQVDFGEYLREAAVLEAVETHPEAQQLELYERLQKVLLDDSPVGDATPAKLRIDALALFGWARDRIERGDRCRDSQVWLRAATQVLAHSSVRRAA